jgi:hypothetical protein
LYWESGKEIRSFGGGSVGNVGSIGRPRNPNTSSPPSFNFWVAKIFSTQTNLEMRYPASPPPLSNQDTYTTWPGGVDPTARVYDSVGGKRHVRSLAKSPKRSALKRRQTPKHRRSTRKALRKANRKARSNTRRY